MTLWAKHLDELGEGLYYAVGRFVKYHGARLLLQGGQTGGTPFLLGQEALEGETLAGQARCYKSRHKGGGARQALNRYATGYTGPHQHEAGVGDAWRTCIGNECHNLASCHACGKGIGRLVLVELVVRHQLILYFKMLEQYARGAGVFGQNHIGLLQNAQGSEGYVFKISHGCGY